MMGNKIAEWAYMLDGMQIFYEKKYPHAAAEVAEISAALKHAVGADDWRNLGGGGCGMVQGWVEYFEELDSDEPKRQHHSMKET